MKRIWVVSAFLALVWHQAHAQSLLPEIGFADSDPFAMPGEAPRRNGILVFGGVYTAENMGNSLIWNAPELEDNYVLGAAYSRDIYEIGAGFVIGGEVGLAGRFGEDEDVSGEIWGGIRLRHHGLVIGDLVISPGVTVGLSAVTGPIGIERDREIENDGDATLLGHLSPEFAFRLRQMPNVELVYKLHHRSGAEGFFSDMGEGSNANVLGVRWRF